MWCHYWKQGLCRVQTTLSSVKNRALDKDLLCRVPLPSAVLGKELHSAKNSLSSAGHSTKKGTRQREELKKYIFFEIPLPSALVKALAKEEISKKNSKILFVERLILGTRQRPPLSSAMPRCLAKFFFVFGLQIFVQPF